MNISSTVDFVGRAARLGADPLLGLRGHRYLPNFWLGLCSPVGQADSLLPIRRPPACATYLAVDRGLEFGETIVTDGQLRLSLTRRRQPKFKVVR
jgi:hypothetical protein